MTRPPLVVILPALDESESVAHVVAGFCAEGARVIVVDNGSSDGTARIGARAGADVLVEPRRGYGSACLAGLDHARALGAELVAFADCDGTHDPTELGRLVAPLRHDEADLALGRRTAREPGALTRTQVVGNGIACVLLRILYGIRVRDIPPFRAARLETWIRLGLRDRSYGLPIETIIGAARAGLRIQEVEVTCRRRRGGSSKVAGAPLASLRAGWRMLALPVRYRFRRPDA